MVKHRLQWFQGIPGLNAHLLEPVNITFVKSHIQKYSILEIKPCGFESRIEMSVLSDLGGHWDVFFLSEVMA